MEAALDVFRVLYEPGKVFERVRERPRVLLPWIVVSVLLVVITYTMLPYIMDSQAASIIKAEARRPGSGATTKAMIPFIGVYLWPILIFIAIAVSAGLLWLFMSLFGGDAKFKTLVSISTYSMITFVLSTAAVMLSLKMHPGVKVSSPQDLQSPLGLQMLMPDAGPFLFTVLAGINVFSIWGVVLTAIGLEVTLKTERSSAYIIAILSELAGIMLLAGLAMMQPQ